MTVGETVGQLAMVSDAKAGSAVSNRVATAAVVDLGLDATVVTVPPAASSSGRVRTAQLIRVLADPTLDRKGLVRLTLVLAVGQILITAMIVVLRKVRVQVGIVLISVLATRHLAGDNTLSRPGPVMPGY